MLSVQRQIMDVLDELDANPPGAPRGLPQYQYNVLPVIKESAGAGMTINTGNNAMNVAIDYRGDGSQSGSIDGNIVDAGGDIDNPGSWTTLINISDTTPFGLVWYIWASVFGDVYMVYTKIERNETSGDAIRYQVLIDGVIVADAKATSDAAGAGTYCRSICRFMPAGYDWHYNPVWRTFFTSEIIYCASSFQIRATRNGSFSSANSFIATGSIGEVATIQTMLNKIDLTYGAS